MAQFGRALRSGRRGRKFKSCHLDHISFKPHFYAVCLFITVSSLPCRYRPSACFRLASLRAWVHPSAPVQERATSPLREFSFRVPLLFLAFFDFGYKNTAPNGAVKLLSLVLICTELHKKRLFLQSLCSSQVQLIAQGYNKTAHCCGRFSL